MLPFKVIQGKNQPKQTLWYLPCFVNISFALKNLLQHKCFLGSFSVCTGRAHPWHPKGSVKPEQVGPSSFLWGTSGFSVSPHAHVSRRSGGSSYPGALSRVQMSLVAHCRCPLEGPSPPKPLCDAVMRRRDFKSRGRVSVAFEVTGEGGTQSGEQAAVKRSQEAAGEPRGSPHSAAPDSAAARYGKLCWHSPARR